MAFLMKYIGGFFAWWKELTGLEYKFYEKFDNDIYDEVNKIQQQLDLTKEERNYIV